MRYNNIMTILYHFRVSDASLEICTIDIIIEKAPSWDYSQDGAFSVVDQSEHFTAKPPLKK